MRSELMFKIGDIEIKNPVVMAPMAGITNMAFRKIIKDFIQRWLVIKRYVMEIIRLLICFKLMKENILLVFNYLVVK